MMLRKNAWTALAVIAAMSLTAWAVAQSKEPAQKREPKKIDPGALSTDRRPELPKCPVSGEPVNFVCSMKTDDGLVYFSSDENLAKFKAASAKYADGVKRQREDLARYPKIQVTCPVGGEPIDKKSYVEKGGKKVYFCCDGCKAKYEADAAQYATKLADSYTYQNKCPVGGEDIDPASFTELPDKTKVYYCCMACEPKLFAEPDKYAAKLAAQGYKIDPAVIKKAAEAAKKNEGKDKKDDHAGHDHKKP